MIASTYPPGLTQLKGSVPLDLEPPGLRSLWEKGGPSLGPTLHTEAPRFPSHFSSFHSPFLSTYCVPGPGWVLCTCYLADSSLTCNIQIIVCSYFRDKAQRRQVTCPGSHSWQAVESGFKPGCVIPEPKLAATTVPGMTGCGIGHLPSLHL